MDKTKAEYREIRAEIASGRAHVYDLLCGLFNRLPDQGLLTMIQSDEMNGFLKACQQMEGPDFKTGVKRIRTYQRDIADKEKDEILNELAIDRTMILRGTGNPNMKPPYEGIYMGEKDYGGCLLEIKQFYRQAGIIPDESVSESPDYVCVELDFMKQLCQREGAMWCSDRTDEKIVACQTSFLKNHLGRWIEEFCDSVEKHALTDFYRGFALLLKAVVSRDQEYLKDLAHP